MDEFPRLPLDPDVYEELDTQLYAIEKGFWQDLQSLQVDRLVSLLPGQPAKPTPPKLPRKLRNTLVSYAHILFYTEACKYPSDAPQLERWLKGLADRTDRRVNDALAVLENRAIFRSLEHHGLSESNRRQIVHEAIQDALQSYLEKARKSSQAATLVETNDGDPLGDLHNRPPLLQKLEAYKQIKKLVSGPHELIPEELIRSTIAQQYGIKPEEVTWDQIRFEVSGLLPYYPAITLVPTPPVPLSPTSMTTPADEDLEAVDMPVSLSQTTVNPKLPSTVNSPSAARKMEAYLTARGLGLTDFSIAAGTTDRTLRNFRKTGKIRRDLFSGIAKAMGITKEELLKP